MKKYEVYCDEANPDVLTSERPRVQHLMIGSLWLPAEIRDELKVRVGELREQYRVWGEIGWSKIAPSREAFFIALADLFLEYGNKLRFRCIAVNHAEIDLGLHDHDAELGFYKFYYHLLHPWILPRNEYRILCDIKSNRDPKRLPVLTRCLARANPASNIVNTQSLPSREVVLIQLCDVLLGAAHSRLNKTLNPSTAKAAFVQRLEAGLGRQLLPTYQTEDKFNVFKIRFGGSR